MPELALAHVTKRFGAVAAVRDVSLTVQAHEVLVLLGPSGSGKTTLLRLIAGLDEPDSGEISLGKQPISALAPKERPFAFMPQSYALYPHLTVAENLTLWPRLRGLAPDEIERLLTSTAQRMGLTELLDRMPRQLRDGQRMRVALARTIMRQPTVYLLDEPLATLDAKLRVQTRAEMVKLNRELQAAMLYATHDTEEAMAFGHRIAVLRDGQVQQVATPQEIYDRPANMFVAGFVGSPAMNFFRAKLRRSGDEFRVDTGTFAVPAPPTVAPLLAAYGRPDIIFGLRPDDLYDRAYAPADRPMTAAHMVVNVAEYLGRDLLLYLLSGPHFPTARVDSRTSVKAGDSLDLLIDASRVHLFDPDTQRAIAGPVQPLRWGLDLGAHPI